MFATKKEGIVFSSRQEFGFVRRKVGKNRTIWYYSFYDENGIRKYRSTGQKTKAAAMDFVMKRRDEGLLKTIDKSKTTFGEYAKDFYDYDKCPIVREKLKRGKTFARSTAYGNRYILTKHIMPYFKNIPISAISEVKINNWLLNLPSKASLANRTVNLAKAILSHIMDYAVKDGVISKNPCKNVERLGEQGARTKAFTREEAIAFIGKPEDWENPMFRIACMIAAMTGMRAAEVLALRTMDVEKDRIHVRHSYNLHDKLKTPKNGDERVVPITEELYNEIMAIAWADPEKYIFSLSRGEEPIAYATLRRYISARSEKLKMKDKSFHSFRAFVNTELVLKNVNETVIRSMVGHADEEMTEHYFHLESGDMKLINDIQKEFQKGLA